LSPIRDSRVLIVRQTGLVGSFMPVTSLFPTHTFVVPPQKSAFLRVPGWWLFSVPQYQINT
jgi:hypothetical protein